MKQAANNRKPQHSFSKNKFDTSKNSILAITFMKQLIFFNRITRTGKNTNLNGIKFYK
jgi:hypothetical protein